MAVIPQPLAGPNHGLMAPEGHIYVALVQLISVSTNLNAPPHIELLIVIQFAAQESSVG